MVKEFKSLSLLEILPESIRGAPKMQAAAQAFDKELHAVTEDIKENLLISRIDELPETVLDLLAWQWHVDFYQPLGLDIETKRKLIRESIAWHRIKGTPAAVEMLTQTIFHESRTKEWFEYGGRPYFFRMVHDISNGTEDVNKTTLAQLKQAIWMGKNVRSWLEMLEFHVHLHDKVEYSEELSTISASRAFQEWMPYGTNPLIDRSGTAERCGAGCMDGNFERDGSYSRDGPLLEANAERGGASDLAHDHLNISVRTSITEDVGEEYLARDDRVSREGHILHGANPLPRDMGAAFSVEADMEDEAGAIDAGGGLSILYSIHRRGEFRRDGTIERGGYAYDDDLDGDRSLLIMDRSGKYCMDGDIERAADGRLVVV